MEQIVDIGLYVSYALIILCTILAVVLPLISALGDPSSLIKSGIGLAALVVIFLIGYAISGNEVLPSYEQFGVDAGTSKFVGGTLITMYILTFIAIIGIAYTEIIKIFR